MRSKEKDHTILTVIFHFPYAGNFSTMTQASAAQQRQEVERALREADQGANF